MRVINIYYELKINVISNRKSLLLARGAPSSHVLIVCYQCGCVECVTKSCVRRLLDVDWWNSIAEGWERVITVTATAVGDWWTLPLTRHLQIRLVLQLH